MSFWTQSSSVKLLEQFSNWLLPLPTPKMSKETHGFLPQKTCFWCVYWALACGQWVKGIFLLIWPLQEANQHPLTGAVPWIGCRTLTAPVGAAWLFPGCASVSDGQVSSICAGQWNTAGQRVTAPAPRGETNWTSSSPERMENREELPFYTNTLSIVEMWVLYTVRPLLIAILVVCCHLKNLLASQ